jgi:hypothetical protein
MIILRTLTLSVLIMASSFTLAKAQDSLTIPIKSYTATKVNASPVIDGNLDDEVWQNVPVATDFTQTAPFEKQASRQKTEIKVIYNDEGIYIGAYMYDSAPDSIIKSLSVRDDGNPNADVFGVALDTYHDKQNMFMFFVSSAGVQRDDRMNIDGFDAVWQNDCKITDKGWIAEIKIPYYAIRFPDKPIHEWGVQFFRTIRRYREESVWQYVPNEVTNYPAYVGLLQGLENLTPPLRLSLTPYVGMVYEHFPYNSNGISNWTSTYNYGLDLKYGLNESFTLDMTLAPDFGQVQSDNQFLNLSAFEIQFQERRPFFTEGVELFKSDEYFYPRRIGKTPDGYYTVLSDTSVNIISNPNKTQLLNAFKITGRTPKQLGVGVLNAIVNQAEAVVEDRSTGEQKTIITEPFSNYNAIAIDQNLSNNSNISFLNTNVSRFDSPNDANLTGLGFRLGNKKGIYNVRGFGAVSQLFNAGPTITGYKYESGFSKIKGNFIFDLSRRVFSVDYNPNDLGILFFSNNIVHNAQLNYNYFKPYGPFLRSFSTVNLRQSETFDNHLFQDFEISTSHWAILKSFNAIYAFSSFRPFQGNDIYEPRVPGRTYLTPAYGGATVGISTDYRKTFALDADIGYYADFVRKGKFYQVKFSPRIRPNDKLLLIPSMDYSFDYNNQGFAGIDTSGTIFFSRRDVHSYNLVFNTIYTMNALSNLTFRVRHNSRFVNAKYFEILNEDGSLGLDTINPAINADRIANFFNIDMVYTWRFAPGSDLVVVWKQAINPPSNNDRYFALSDDFSYRTQLYNTFKSNQLNSFTIKVLYFLDFKYLSNKLRKK